MPLDPRIRGGRSRPTKLQKGRRTERGPMSRELWYRQWTTSTRLQVNGASVRVS